MCYCSQLQRECPGVTPALLASLLCRRYSVSVVNNQAGLNGPTVNFIPVSRRDQELVPGPIAASPEAPQ